MVGVAFSGGGVTALLCTLCASNFLENHFAEQYSSKSTCVSGVSGGTLGYILYENVNSDELIFPPEQTSDLEYNDLYTEGAGKEGIWFANALNYLPDLPGSGLDASGDTNSKERRYFRTLASNNFDTNWWELSLDAIARLGYNIPGESMTSGKRPFLAGTALLDQDACPISVDESSGILENSSNILVPTYVDMNNLKLKTADGRISVGVDSTIQAGSFSSAFWAASIVQSSVQYALLKDALIDLSEPKSEESFYIMDGGILDTTGIVNLLRQKKERIVALYNNNAGSLTILESPIAYLFGVKTKTDSMNSLQGPKLAQVFPSDLFDEVLKNLTDTTLDGPNMLATLNNVPVLRNKYFSVEPYILRSLVIISLELSEPFLDSIPSKLEVKDHVSQDWPNDIPLGMSTLDANLLCSFTTWKLLQHEQTLSTIFD